MCHDNTVKCAILNGISAILRDLIRIEIDINPNPVPRSDRFPLGTMPGIPERFPDTQGQANQRQQQIQELSNLIQQLILLDKNGQIDYDLINEMQLKFYKIHQILQQISQAKSEINSEQHQQLNKEIHDMLSRILC
jgi:hypothetical protein